MLGIVSGTYIKSSVTIVMVVTPSKPDATSGCVIKVQHLASRKVMAHTHTHTAHKLSHTIFYPDSSERSSCTVTPGGNSSSLECLLKGVAGVREAKEISVRNWRCLVQRREAFGRTHCTLCNYPPPE